MLRAPKLLNLRVFTKNHIKCLATKPVPMLDDEYTKQPEYPAIENRSFRSKLLKRRKHWYDQITSLNTVEEKLLAINLPRYYGYKCLMLSDNNFPYDCLPFIQHSTRTIFETGLPPLYQRQKDVADTLVSRIKSEIESAIAFENTGYRIQSNAESVESKQREKDSRIVAQINRVMINALAADIQHLDEVEVDMDVRHEAFWFVGGIEPPVLTRRIRKGCSYQKDMADEPVNRQFQYVGKPLLTLRHAHPLPPVHHDDAHDEVNNSGLEKLPKFSYDPRTIGYAHDYRHGTTIPGFWPGSPQEFGVLSYLSRSYLCQRSTTYGSEDAQESLHALAVLSSFGWLFGQAAYQGFSTFADPTYPLATQTIITDGQFWSFYAYQLNTTRIHQDAIEENPKVNHCWGTGEMKLYEEIDGQGNVAGFNDDVLRQLILFYLNRPASRAGTQMKPYLSPNERTIAEIEDPERRVFLEKRYKHLMANRPRHRLVPEIYHWEKIYKIDNVTKPLDPKRRFYELGVNPFHRRLDDHTPVYVPKAIRPGGPKGKDKWAKSFYPLTK